MFKLSKKIAASMAELLIILAIIGILSVLYRKTVNEDAVTVKYGYKTLINNMIGFAATETEDYTVRFGTSSICEKMYRTVNTLGEKNCIFSVIPVVPNFITTSGMRFFGLEQRFLSHDNFGEESVFIQVDLDGLLGKNKSEEDIWPFELMRSGRIRPAGSSTRQAKNVARDAALLAVNLSYVPAGAVNKNEFQTIGNRISYAEAQCLSGNIFPYRDAYPPHKIQMCVENADVRNAINAFNDNFIGARPNIDDKNGDGVVNIQDRDEIIRRHRRDLATSDKTCENIYKPGGIANGVTPITDTGMTRCGYCYKIAYIRDYCSSPEDIWVDLNAETPVRRRDAEGNEICPASIVDETDINERELSQGLCSTPTWLEKIN